MSEAKRAEMIYRDRDRFTRAALLCTPGRIPLRKRGWIARLLRWMVSL